MADAGAPACAQGKLDARYSATLGGVSFGKGPGSSTSATTSSPPR
jgi:hypothetical protein